MSGTIDQNPKFCRVSGQSPTGGEQPAQLPSLFSSNEKELSSLLEKTKFLPAKLGNNQEYQQGKQAKNAPAK